MFTLYPKLHAKFYGSSSYMVKAEISTFRQK